MVLRKIGNFFAERFGRAREKYNRVQAKQDAKAITMQANEFLINNNNLKRHTYLSKNPLNERHYQYITNAAEFLELPPRAVGLVLELVPEDRWVGNLKWGQPQMLAKFSAEKAKEMKENQHPVNQFPAQIHPLFELIIQRAKERDLLR